MMNRLYIILVAFLFTSCGDNPKEQDKAYYVIKDGKNYIKSKRFKEDPPPPTDIVYGEYNFILAGKDKVYFHTIAHRHLCRFGISEDNFIKEPFIGITPEQIKEIKSENVISFLDSAVTANYYFFPGVWMITVSSSTDTVRNPAFKQISEYLTKDIIYRYNIRRWTEEESYAINAKEEGKTYTPSISFCALNFDSSAVCKWH